MTKKVEDMSAEERKEYEESLDKAIQLNSIKSKQKLIDEAKETEEKEQKERLEKEQKEHDAQVIADFKALNPEVKPENEPVPKIDTEGEVKNNSSDKNKAFINSYYKRNSSALTKSDRSVKLEEKPDEVLL